VTAIYATKRLYVLSFFFRLGIRGTGYMAKLTVGSLFAGIGGFDLGFERAGFEIRWQVEIDPFCRAVLAKHWPDVRRYEDVRTVHRAPCFDDFCGGCVESVDVLVGGFPCQDVSHAGARVGIAGERSGLWREFGRLAGELRPRYVVVENVTGLTDRGIDVVLGDLAALGFDAEWSVLSACAVGAPHTRERVFIVAYPASERPGQLWRIERPTNRTAERHLHWTESEPPRERVVNGIPDRLDRLKSLGNAIVPQEAEWIARRILEAEGLTA
jgi:DNA (cytosine-5)-methyltransferase 1